jgi:hypothetical protein
MPTYSVILVGTGIKVPSIPDPIIGFVTTRRVNAPNEENACERAMRVVEVEWASGEYRDANIGSEPRLDIEEIRRLGLFARFFSRAPTKGYTFYSHD